VQLDVDHQSGPSFRDDCRSPPNGFVHNAVYFVGTGRPVIEHRPRSNRTQRSGRTSQRRFKPFLWRQMKRTRGCGFALGLLTAVRNGERHVVEQDMSADLAQHLSRSHEIVDVAVLRKGRQSSAHALPPLLHANQVKPRSPGEAALDDDRERIPRTPVGAVESAYVHGIRASGGAALDPHVCKVCGLDINCGVGRPMGIFGCPEIAAVGG